MRYATRELPSGYLRATACLLLTAYCLLPSAYPSPATAQESSYAIIISGASGEEIYAKQFAEWSESLRQALVEGLNFAPEKIKVLSEKPSNGAARATAEEVRRAFESLRGEATAESTVFVFLIGHGTFDGASAKFNLVGPDLPVTAYDGLISALPARRVVVVNTASASGEFIKPLAGKNRIIVTATRSGQERNATRFAGYFIEALTNPAADADQNKRVSVLEAFTYAAKLTDEMYKSAGRLATEHAVLEDSGGGALARTTYFNVPVATQAGGDNRAAKALVERTRLEEEIEQLKARKSQIPVSDYEATLEKLLIELAKLNQANKPKQ
ncbi:MAG TPA: hypothetical protein VM943_01950 [Pyrinomonadaceae bacterium]|nr:hypothetical protein [Pyrinomonadaceae bacterium]